LPSLHRKIVQKNEGGEKQNKKSFLWDLRVSVVVEHLKLWTSFLKIKRVWNH